MDQSLLKTSIKQRIVIITIAIIMLGSIIASYVAIVLGNNGSSTSSSRKDEALIAKYETAFKEKQSLVMNLSGTYFNEFVNFKSQITAYNENSANSNGLKTADLKIGTGRELADGDVDYLAYYVGWCPDESIFDSTFDNASLPTGFSSVLDASIGLIEGWRLGVIGMRTGGIREITIPGELAYADAMKICGGYNKPLKFIVMAVENAEPLKSAAAELATARLKLQYAYQGLDYDEILYNDTESSENSEKLDGENDEI